MQWRQVWRVLGPAAVVAGLAAAAAWALKADDKVGWTLGAGVVAAVWGAFSPSVVQWLQGRRRTRADQARMLAAGLVMELPASVAWLLHPDQAVVSFFGRKWTLQQLQMWCEDEAAGVVRLLTAGGGVGKSRLARHLADVELPRWACWRVAVGGETLIVDALHGGNPPGRLLLILDYAEARPPAQLAALLCASAGTDGRDGRRVRVLLLARTAGTWWASLSAAYTQQAALVDALTTPTSNVITMEAQADARDAQEIVVDAASQFAIWLHYAAPHVPVRRRDPDTPLLRLHAEALVAVLGGARSSDGRHDVLTELLGHETRYWRYCAQRAGLTGTGADDESQRELVAMAALFGADDDTQVADLTTRVPGLSGIPLEQVTRWVRWLRELYPAHDSQPALSGRLGTLQPDLLAEHLAVDVLLRYSMAQCTTVFTGLTTARAVQALRVLGRAISHQHDAQRLIDVVLRADLVTMTDAVLQVATQFPGLHAPRLAALLTDADLDAETLAGVAERVPYPSRELNPVALACTSRLIAEAGMTPPRRAYWLTRYAARLAEAGRHAEALMVAEKAADLYRDLAANDRDAYLPQLATSVNNYAIALAEAGQQPKALILSQETVTFRRELAASNRDTYLPDLAQSLSNHGMHLSEAGLHSEALIVSAEALALRRELATNNRNAYLPQLATSVINHAIALAEAGRHPEALILSQEAVTLRRKLAASNRDAYLPDLAKSLITHTHVFVELGRHVEALTISQEAVALFDELATANPLAFGGRLTTAADAYADLLDAMSRQSEAEVVRKRYSVQH